MDPIINWIEQNLLLTIIGAVTIVQIVPIEINPWSWIGGLIKRGIGIADLQKELDELKNDVQQDKVDNWRWNILDFGNTCRNDRRHTKEEWAHVIDQLKQYESYCERNKIDNGRIEEESKYLRSLYQERLQKNDFL